MMTKNFVQELANEIYRIENEKRVLSEELKTIFKEYENKLDTKAFKAAFQIAKIRSKHAGSDEELDMILGALDGVSSFGTED